MMTSQQKNIIYLSSSLLVLFLFFILAFLPLAGKFIKAQQARFQGQATLELRQEQEQELSQMVDKVNNLEGQINALGQRLLDAHKSSLELIKTFERLGQQSGVDIEIRTLECEGSGLCFNLITKSNFQEFLVFLGNLERMNFFNSVEKLDIKYQSKDNYYKGDINIRVYTLQDV